MLSGHPYIKRTFVKERYCEGRGLEQTLFVETSLKNPDSGDKSHNGEWDRLMEQLTGIVSNGFTDCTSFRILGLDEKTD